MATANYGLGSGTPRQELERWMKESGRLIVHDEGEQLRLDGGSTRMFRLYNRKGDSVLVSAETAAEYGLRPTEERARPSLRPANLFSPEQGFMFTEEV